MKPKSFWVAVKLQEQWSETGDQGGSIMKERTNYSHAAVASFIKGAQEEFGFRLFESKLYEARGEIEEALASVEIALRSFAGSAELQLRRGTLLGSLTATTKRSMR